MEIRTKAQVDKSTLDAIGRAEKQIQELEGKRSKYSGRELWDIDEQIARLRCRIAHFKAVLAG